MSFWELVVVAVVALLVLGPEKLPGAIRTVSGFVRSIRQFGQQMSTELNNELRIHDLHQKLRDAEAKNLLNLTPQEEAALAELKQAAAEVNSPYALSNTAIEAAPASHNSSHNSDAAQFKIQSPTNHLESTVATTTQTTEENLSAAAALVAPSTATVHQHSKS